VFSVLDDSLALPAVFSVMRISDFALTAGHLLGDARFAFTAGHLLGDA
jgi:hypothetical protein